MAAWGFEFSDVAVLDDAVLAKMPEGLPLPAVPTLAVVEGEPAVYLVEPGVKRHVPNPTVMDTWKFDWATIETRTDLEAHLSGVPVTDRPFLARGTDGRVFLVEPPPSLWADDLQWAAPTELGRGQQAQLNLQARNRGSAEWTPNDFRLVPSPSVRCTNCDEALDTTVAPEGRTTLSVTVVAPDTVGPHRMCFALEASGSLFSAVGQGGPAEEQCVTVNVVDNPVDLPAVNVPGTRPTVANVDSVSTERGCSSAAGAPGILGLFVFGLLRRRS
ncbi:MAG: hypothetical protein R3E66_09615 [bacterium]